MSTRDDIISIIQDPSVATVTALVEYVEAQRADEQHFLHSRGLRSVARVEQQKADLSVKLERGILGEPCAEHGKAACNQTHDCTIEWAQKRLSRDVVHDLMKENIDD